MGAEVIGGRWGTWEELLLGGAVLRHGTHDWNVVAAELRARAVCPYPFTPELCKTKYEDLQHRYAGCSAWFEELRKKRMAELKLALELSEDSIESLESRLETLKSEKGDDRLVDYGSSQTENLEPFHKYERFESSSKEGSKDGLSASSFTQEARAEWSLEKMQSKPEALYSFEQGKVSSFENKLVDSFQGQQGGTVKRRRGERKRKHCSQDVKEGRSVAETDALESAERITSTSNRGEICGSSRADGCKSGLREDETEDLIGIFGSFSEIRSASLFHHRLESQKRGRYKKMIRRHMDLETIRSSISSCSIVTAKELFRDLLLLVNNALVFYSKTTHEYKSALLLREFVMKRLRQHFKFSISKAKSSTGLSSVRTSMCKRQEKSRVSSDNHKVSRKPSNGGKRSSNAAKIAPSLKALPRKVGNGSYGTAEGQQQSKTPLRGRKRVQRR